ncbi:MAG: hypothetical protein ACXVCX_16405 [Ktedonobacterales bacterium]
MLDANETVLTPDSAFAEQERERSQLPLGSSAMSGSSTAYCTTATKARSARRRGSRRLGK